MDPKDLLKGEIVRSLAASVAQMWNRLKHTLERGGDLIKARDLVENQGSFNAIIVFLEWYRLVFDRFEVLSAGALVVVRDSLEKQLNLRASTFLDRWVFGSQWANVWAEGAVLNFQRFSMDLSDFHGKLAECGADNFITTVDEGIGQLLGRVTVFPLQRV